MPTRPVWAEVSLSRLTANYAHLRDRLHAGSAGAELLAVVKANAYGHGVEVCGPALAAAGARWLGVTSVEEGAALRRALGVLPGSLSSARILVMSALWEGEADAVLDRALTPQVWEPYHFELLRASCARRGRGGAAVHLEVDTGMARQGVAPGAALGRLLAGGWLGGEAGVRVEGVMTHFSAPEQADARTTDEQLERFAAALTQLREAGVRPEWVHAGNSATVFDLRHVDALAALAARFGARLLVRPGLGLYGYPVRFTPEGGAMALGAAGEQAALRPVLGWKTRVLSLRELAVGEGAGYGSTFCAARPTRIALVPAGYADGLNRLLSGRGAMLVRGQRAPIAGRISMDQTMLDVTDVPGVAIGDEVAILGEQGEKAITASEHAELCGTIPYEVLCRVAARVPRGVVE